MIHNLWGRLLSFCLIGKNMIDISDKVWKCFKSIAGLLSWLIKSQGFWPSGLLSFGAFIRTPKLPSRVRFRQLYWSSFKSKICKAFQDCCRTTHQTKSSEKLIPVKDFNLILQKHERQKHWDLVHLMKSYFAAAEHYPFLWCCSLIDESSKVAKNQSKQWAFDKLPDILPIEDSYKTKYVRGCKRSKEKSLIRTLNYRDLFSNRGVLLSFELSIKIIWSSKAKYKYDLGLYISKSMFFKKPPN